jgi:hypothetical protein
LVSSLVGVAAGFVAALFGFDTTLSTGWAQAAASAGFRVRLATIFGLAVGG